MTLNFDGGKIFSFGLSSSKSNLSKLHHLTKCLQLCYCCCCCNVFAPATVAASVVVAGVVVVVVVAAMLLLFPTKISFSPFSLFYLHCLDICFIKYLLNLLIRVS